MTILMMNRNNCTPKSIAEILSLRYQWECIVSNYKIKNCHGTADNLKWFIKYGMRSNRFRPNFDEAMVIAKEIINEVKKNEYENINLPGLHR